MKIDRVLFLCMTLSSVAPLWAKESGSNSAISAAFSNKNYNKGLELVRQAFATLKPSQSVEAATSIKSVLAFAPIDERGAVVVAAIEGNRSLGTAILNAAVSGASRDEQLVILSRLSFAVSQSPNSFSSISASVPGMLSQVRQSIPVSEALTSPDYNPANSPSDTPEFISPHHPDLREDRQDLSHDREQVKDEREGLRDLREQLKDALQGHEGKEVIQRLRQQIEEKEDRIKENREDINHDRKDLIQDVKDAHQDADTRLDGQGLKHD